MDLDCELNFTKICRCCKRTSIGMTSIFNESVHPTYPPVTEMIRCIASLNVQENDGLPSLVCTSCVDNIQDAYTFILHLIMIDKELQQILLARSKQTDTVSQATNDLNQYISTDSAQKENESESLHKGVKLLEIHDRDVYVNYPLKLEGFDEPIQNFYQHGSADNNENINFVVKVEDVEDVVCENKEGIELLSQREESKIGNSEQTLPEITRKNIHLNYQKHSSELYEDIGVSNSFKIERDLDASENVDEPEEENDEISPKLRAKRQKTTSNFDDVLHVERKDESSPGLSLMLQELKNPKKMKPDLVYIVNDDNLLKVEKTVEMEELEDEHAMGADKDYQGNNKDANNVDSSDCDYTRHGNRKKARKRSSLRPGRLHKVKTTPSLTAMSRTVEDIGESNSITSVDDNTNYSTHLDAAEDINETEVSEDKEGDKRVDSSERKSNLETSESLDQISPKLPAQHQNMVSNLADELIFKCKLCGYTHQWLSHLRLHFQSHLKDRPFACPKCNSTFTQKSSMRKHLRKCNGVISKHALGKEARRKEKVSKEGLSLTLEDLDDPAKMLNKYYTVSKKSDVLNNDPKSRTEQGKRTSNIGGASTLNYKTWSTTKRSKNIEEVGNEEISAKLRVNRWKSISNVADAAAFKCKLCEYTTMHMAHLKLHLHSHFKDKPFACPKCTSTFTQHSSMLIHLRKCNGEMSEHTFKRRPLKQVISLTLQDLKDPEKLKKYYTVTGILGKNNDEDAKVQSIEDCKDNVDIEEINLPSQTNTTSNSSMVTVYKCKRCAYTSKFKANFIRHLQTHSGKSFACSKCNVTFAKRGYMLVHWRSCKGELKRENTSKQVKLLMNTLQNLESTGDIVAPTRDESPEEVFEYVNCMGADVDYDNDNDNEDDNIVHS